jgi:putative hydrolase
VFFNRPKIVADLHVHTVSSGHAYSTLEEYIEAAKKKGLKAIAITDHGPAMPGGAPLYHFANLPMLPDILYGMRILRGAEVNITSDQGTLDIPDEVLKNNLDFAIIATHPKCGYDEHDEATNTQAVLKAMEHPNVRIIAHPGNPMYPIDYKKIIPIAKEKGILLELNNSSLTVSRKGSYERCFEIAKFVKSVGWKVALGSDSHISTMIGKLDEVLKMAYDAGLKDDDIVNTSMDLVKEYILKK